ncbi:MAG: hypothetical protein P4L53_24960 [Candidatus Obscuribacterales bacterium]|nr:hypothetical protein [Candidatus Obscuribacterales bacterium]
MDKAATSSTEVSKLLEGPSTLLKSAGFVFQNDLNGAQQIADHIRGTKSVQFDFIKAGDARSGWSAAGTLIGHVAEYAVLNKVLGGVLRSAEAPVISVTRGATVSGISGATIGLLQPITDDKANFAYAKFSQAAVGFGTFATMSGTEKFLAKGSLFGRPGRRTLADSISVNTVAGAASGVVGSELSSILNNERFSTGAEVRSQAASGAAFGAVFGAVDAKLSRAKLSDETSPEFKRTFPDHNLPSTEKFVKDHYDVDKPLSSPILSWLAIHRPELRPENYESLSQGLGKDEFLDLASWSPEGRVKVVKALRALSQSDLTKDAQMDEFIGALKNRDTANLNRLMDDRDADAKARIEWHNAFNELVEAKNTHAPDASLEDVVAGDANTIRHPEIQTAIDKTLKAENSRTSATWFSAEDTGPYLADASTSLQSFLKDRQLPELRYQLTAPGQTGEMAYALGHLSVNPGRIERHLSGEQIATEFHEVRHHEDGSLKSDVVGAVFKRLFQGYKTQASERQATEGTVSVIRNMLEWLDRDSTAGKEILKSVADPHDMSSHIWSQRFNDDAATKLMNAADAGKKVTFAKKIPDEVKELSRLAQLSSASNSELDPQLQEQLRQVLFKRAAELDAQVRSLYVNGYVGEKSEQRAWSAGLLMQLRTRAWGLPDVASAPELPAIKGNERPQDLGAFGYVYNNNNTNEPAFSEELIDSVRAWTNGQRDQPW